MGHNPNTGTIDISKIEVIVHSSDTVISGFMVRSLVAIGYQKSEICQDVETTFEAIDRILPNLVIIIVNAGNPTEWEDAYQINKKRAVNNQRTPKVLGLIKPSADDLLKAKKDGFFDIIALPMPSGALAGRIETVISRLN